MRVLAIAAAMAVSLIAIAAPAAAADYWVRGEAVLQGNNIPANCGTAGTYFSAIQSVPNQAQCNAHPTCTAAKVTAVNNWIQQFNTRNLGQCNQYVQQAQRPCQYNC